MRFNFGLLVIILASPWAVSARAEWQVLDARWRPDANPWAVKQAWDGWIWSEGWCECIVRLRSVPTEDVRLGFRIGAAERMEVTVSVKPPAARLESISFSPRIDRVYIYIRSLDGGRLRGAKVRLDGKDVSDSCRWTQGPIESGLTLVEAELESPWELGSYQTCTARCNAGQDECLLRGVHRQRP